MPPPADASQKTSPLSPCFLSNPPLLPSVLRDRRPRDRRPLFFSSKEEKEPKADKREREKQSLCHLPLKKQPPVPLFKQIMPALYLLFESASGYALLEAHGLDAIGGSTPAVQESVTDLDRFGKVRKNSLGIRRPSVDERDREREREREGEREMPPSSLMPSVVTLGVGSFFPQRMPRLLHAMDTTIFFFSATKRERK
jgi:hypothetical protein